jgi:hypothetical protein
MQSKLEPIFQEIIGLIEKNKEPVFAVFDFDNTCVINDLEDVVFNYMARNGLFKSGDSEAIFEK